MAKYMVYPRECFLWTEKKKTYYAVVGWRVPGMSFRSNFVLFCFSERKTL